MSEYVLSRALELVLQQQQIDQSRILWMFSSSATVETGRLGESALIVTEDELIVVSIPFLVSGVIAARTPISQIARTEVIDTFQGNMHVTFLAHDKETQLAVFIIPSTQNTRQQQFSREIVNLFPDAVFRPEIPITQVSQKYMETLNEAIVAPRFDKPLAVRNDARVRLDPLEMFSLLNKDLVLGVNIDNLFQGTLAVAQTAVVGHNISSGVANNVFVTNDELVDTDIEIIDESVTFQTDVTDTESQESPSWSSTRSRDADARTDSRRSRARSRADNRPGYSTTARPSYWLNPRPDIRPGQDRSSAKSGVTCEQCGAVNKSSYSHCVNCGTKLESTGQDRTGSWRDGSLFTFDLGDNNSLQSDVTKGCATQLIYIVIGIMAVFIYHLLVGP